MVSAPKIFMLEANGGAGRTTVILEVDED